MNIPYQILRQDANDGSEPRYLLVVQAVNQLPEPEYKVNKGRVSVSQPAPSSISKEKKKTVTPPRNHFKLRKMKRTPTPEDNTPTLKIDIKPLGPPAKPSTSPAQISRTIG